MKLSVKILLDTIISMHAEGLVDGYEKTESSLQTRVLPMKM